MRFLRFNSVGWFILLTAAAIAGCSDDTSSPADTLDLCETDQDCPEGYWCNEGSCTQGSRTCTTDDECPIGQTCQAGICIAGGTDGGVDGGTDGGDEGGDEQVELEPDIEVLEPGMTGTPPVFELDFGAVQVGVEVIRRVVIKNAGRADLRIIELFFEESPGVEDFSVAQEMLDDLPLVLTPEQELTIEVTYLAGDGVSDYGKLDMVTNDPDETLVKFQLTSEFKGTAVINASTDSLDFGDIPVGEESQPLAFTVSNQGSGNAVLTVDNIYLERSDNPDFDLSVVDADQQPVSFPKLLNNDDYLDVAVSYHPQFEEVDHDRVVIASDDPLNSPLLVDLSGEGVVGDIEVQPAPVDLGQVRVGVPTEQVVTLSNTGGAGISITGVYLTDAGPEWSLTSSDLVLADLQANPHALAPGETVTVTLGFLPVDEGLETGTLVIKNSSAESQLNVAISAEGFRPASLQLIPDPAEFDFGMVQLDAQSGTSQQATRELSIGNAGGAPLEITGIQRAPGTSEEFSWQPETLPPIATGEEIPLELAFEPAGIGEKLGALLVDTNDPDIQLDGVTGRFQIDLSARGIDPIIDVNPAGSHDFGEVYLGDQVELLVTVENDSTDPLQVDDIRLTGGSSPAYTLHDIPAFPVSLAGPADDLVFRVAFQPASVGLEAGELEIHSSDIGRPLITLTLSGSGIGCDDNWRDCDGDPATGAAGCETDISTDIDHCGACNNPCTNDHGVTDCQAGVCVPYCDNDFDDCDGNPDNGCETSLTTVDDCGGCDVACVLDNAVETCANQLCAIDHCDDGYTDCDDDDASGCEIHTAQDSDHCGSCTTQCLNQHGTTSCIAGNCNPLCDQHWDNCDSDPVNGCETSLLTTSDCGGCGVVCTLPHAYESCSTGICHLTGCIDGYANCDGNESNGCETYLNTNPSCNDAIQLPQVCGDTYAGFLCPEVCVSGPSLSERGERYYRIYVAECSDCWADLRIRARLISPAGTDYNLYIYEPCGTLLDASLAGPGEHDYVTGTHSDTAGVGGEGRTYFLEVRHNFGDSCENWTLDIKGGCKDGW